VRAILTLKSDNLEAVARNVARLPRALRLLELGRWLNGSVVLHLLLAGRQGSGADSTATQLSEGTQRACQAVLAGVERLSLQVGGWLLSPLPSCCPCCIACAHWRVLLQLLSCTSTSSLTACHSDYVS